MVSPQNFLNYGVLDLNSLELPELFQTLTADGSAIVTAPAGSRATLSLETQFASFELGTIEGVPKSEIESIELVVGYAPPGADTPDSPAGVETTFENLNTEIYGLMWGPSEFTATGSLSTYEREGILGDLELPILFTAGRYDEATPETVAYFHSLAPNSKIAIFENSAHMTMLDEPEEYVAAVREFLNEVDQMQ